VATDRSTAYKKMSCDALRDRMSVAVKGKPQSNGSVLALKVERK
jgi:hypothetical protein